MSDNPTTERHPSTDMLLREELWSAIYRYSSAPTVKVTEACAAAVAAILKVIPAEAINDEQP